MKMCNDRSRVLFTLSFNRWPLCLQACNQLEIAAHIEMMATMLKRDVVAIMKVALAGTETSRFTDVMEAAFMDNSKLPQQVTRYSTI